MAVTKPRVPNTPINQGRVTGGVPQPSTRATTSDYGPTPNPDTDPNVDPNTGYVPRKRAYFKPNPPAPKPAAAVATGGRWIGTDDPEWNQADADKYAVETFPTTLPGGQVEDIPAGFPGFPPTPTAAEIAAGGPATFGRVWSTWVNVADEQTAQVVLSMIRPYFITKSEGTQFAVTFDEKGNPVYGPGTPPGYVTVNPDGTTHPSTLEELQANDLWESNRAAAQRFSIREEERKPTLSPDIIGQILDAASGSQQALTNIQKLLSSNQISFEQALALGDFILAGRLSRENKKLSEDMAALQSLSLKVNLLAVLAQNPHLLQFMGAIGGLDELFAAAGINFADVQANLMQDVPPELLDKEPNVQQLAQLTPQQRMLVVSYWSSKLGIPPAELLAKWRAAGPGSVSGRPERITL